MMTNGTNILNRWQLLSPYLDNWRQQICWAAAETLVIGQGGCQLLAAVTGIAASTISARARKMRLTKCAQAGSLIRTAHHAGRKLIEVSDPEIEPALQVLLSEETAGDPMNLQRWVRSSTRNLSKRLIETGTPSWLSYRRRHCSAKWDILYEPPKGGKQEQSIPTGTSNSNTSRR